MNPRIAGLALAALGGTSSLAWATEYGTVVSSTPILAAVPVTQRECVAEAAPAPREGSGAGALAGAVVGAALGNALGGGSGRAISTGIGMIAGAALGNHAEAQEAARTAPPLQRCRDLTRYEQRTVGYDVVYEYQGVQRSVRLAQAPGSHIPLDVQVVPAGQVMPAAPAPMPAARPAYRTPADNRVDDEARRAGYPAAPADPAYGYPSYPAYPAYPAEAPVVERASPSAWPYVIVGGIAALAIADAVRHDRRGPPRPYWRHR